jgi:DNA-binding transcriptional MerR regulator
MYNISFSNSELSKILDRPSRMIIDWTERGLIEADITPATGPGSRRRYSYTQVLRAALGIHLKEKFGMSRHLIIGILRMLSDNLLFWDWGNNFKNSRMNFYNIINKLAIDPRTAEAFPGLDKEIEIKYDKWNLEREHSPDFGYLLLFLYENEIFPYVAVFSFEEVGEALKIITLIKKEEGTIITDIIIIDLVLIKTLIDQRIEALT